MQIKTAEIKLHCVQLLQKYYPENAYTVNRNFQRSFAGNFVTKFILA